MTDNDRINKLAEALLDALAPDGEALLEAWANGASYAELGRKFGVSASTAYSRVMRIRDHLGKHGLLHGRWLNREM